MGSGEPQGGHLRVPDAEIEFLLDRGMPSGGMTVRALGTGEIPGRMTFAARQDLILCGPDEASRLLAHLGAPVTFTAPDGIRRGKGVLLLGLRRSPIRLSAPQKRARQA